MREHYESMEKVGANYVPLSPISFLKRASKVYADRVAISYGSSNRTWAETGRRCQSIASGLRQRGIGRGDTVSVLAPNIPELFELHFAVPMTGAVLNTINTRLEPGTIAYILAHSDTRLAIVDTSLREVVRQALALNGSDVPVVDIQAGAAEGFARTNFEELAATTAEPDDWGLPEDEWQAVALNYTSGTSGRPKGVVYHHRGAYLMAMGTVAAWSLPQHPTYLSVVPMFHCNGWNHP